MSNIFDALRKKQDVQSDGGSREGNFPVQPERRGDVGRVRPLDLGLLRQIDSLRDRIDLELPRTGRRVIAVVPSVTGEGASTVSLHIARAMARVSEGKVLLIDADLERGNHTLSHLVGSREPRAGLADLLAGTVDLSRAVLSTDEANLHFLPSGRESGRPGEISSSERLKPFIDEVGRLYRAVVVDCPSVLENPEVPGLGAFTDGIVLVVRAHRTRREVVKKALALLEGSRCRVLGVVLNQRRYPIPDFLYRRL